MKILHITRQFSPSIGGIEDYVYSLSLEQQKNGFEVTVLTTNTNFQDDTLLESNSNIDGIDAIRMPWSFSKRYPIIWIKPSFLNAFDIIHIHAVDFFVDYISFLKKIGLIKPKLCLTTHGGFFHTPKQQFLKKIFFQTITRFSLLSLYKVFTISPNDHALFTQLKSDCVLVPNGVRMQKFGKSALDQARLDDLIYLGRFSSNKKVLWLIEAFSIMKNPKGKLKLVGPSATGDIAEIKRLIDKCNANDKIELLLDQTDFDIMNHITTSKAVVSASEYEGFGLSVIELMSYGLIPFLSSNPDSFIEFVKESKLGANFDYTHIDFEEKYNHIMESWNCEMPSQALNYAQNYSWTETAKLITNEYQ